MQIVTTKASAKVAAVAASLAMASAMLSFVPAVHAQTPDAGATCTITSDLTIGSTGAQVICLQAALVAKGYLVMPVGVSMGYFGPLTQSAVAKWQSANNIAPAVGYFGPISRAAFTAAPGTPGSSTCATKFDPNTGLPCVSTTTPDSTGTLKGTDGTIEGFTLLGSLSNEEVAEGGKNVQVLGADIETSTDGDVALKSVRVAFDYADTSGSTRLNRYIKSVSVYLGSKKIGSADVDEFSKSGTVYSKTISLSGDTTIEADETATLYVAVDAATTIDSGDISGDSWTVAVTSVRYIDGSGVYTTTSDFEIGNEVGINFVDFGTAANTDLKISTDSSSPAQGIVVVSETVKTNNVTLLKGRMKVGGTEDVLLNELPVTFTTDASGGVVAVTGSVKLKIDGKTYTESVSSSASAATVTFDRLDLDLEAGDTVNFEVLADINKIGTGFAAGSVLKADVTGTNRQYIDIENAQGDQLASGVKSGTATGKYQEFRVNGIGLTLDGSPSVSIAAGNGASDDQATFRIKFKVTAIGDTIYVSSLADAMLSGVTTGKTSVLVDRAGTATIGGTSVTIANLTDTTKNTAGLYQIEEGDSETFEITTTVQLPAAGAAGQFRVSLSGVSWTTDGTDATPNNVYNSSLDSFKTSYTGLN